MESWLLAWKLSLCASILLQLGRAAAPSQSATAALSLATRREGKGAVLAYNITCPPAADCNEYVGAIWHAKTAIANPRNATLSLWIRFSRDIEVSLSIKDKKGDNFRVPLQASLERPSSEVWGPVHVGHLSKKPITEIAIVVRSRRRVAVQGQIYFDDITLQKKTDVFAFDPEHQGQRSPPGPTALPPIGVNIHLLRDDASLELARAAGFRFVRMDLLWTNVERRGRFRFVAYDSLLRALEARGMGVLWILDYGHPDHGGGPPRTLQDVAAFSQFAAAVAAHFAGHNVRYEIWNEPDNPQFWMPSPNPTEYAVLLHDASAAMRRADPSALISSGGVSRFDLPFLSRAVDRSIGLAAVSVHPYPKHRPEVFASELASLRNWVSDELGDKTEVWESEWGYSATITAQGAMQDGHSEHGRRLQSNLAAREILTVWSLGFPLGVWYDLRDDGDDAANPEQNYGLLDSHGLEKPAMTAMRTLLHAAQGRMFVGMVQEVPAGVHAMRLDGTADRLFMVWNDQIGGSCKLEFPGTRLLSATDSMGNPLKIKSRAGMIQMKLDESGGPVYLRFKLTNITSE